MRTKPPSPPPPSPKPVAPKPKNAAEKPESVSAGPPPKKGRKGTQERRIRKKLQITFDPGLLERVDRAADKAGLSRSRWLELAVKKALP